MIKEKGITQNWSYREIENESVLQTYSNSLSARNFYLYDIENNRPCFSNEIKINNIINITPFICVGLSILIHNCITKEHNMKAEQTLNSLYQQNYFNNSKELYDFLNYLNNFSDLEIESKKVLYVSFLLHQSTPTLRELEIKKTISFLLLQFCLNKNRFVKICADLFNSIWSDLPKLLYTYNKSLSENKSYVFEYEIPNTNKKTNILNEQNLCEILTLRVLYDYFIYEDKALSEQDIEIRRKTKENSNHILDYCENLLCIDNTSVINQYLQGKFGRYGLNSDNMEFICNNQTDLFKVYGLLSVYQQPQYYANSNGTLDKEVYEELMYIEQLYNNRVRCKHTRWVQYSDLISTLMTLPHSIRLLNVKPIIENSKQKELEKQVSELSRQLNVAKNRIKELKKEQTLNQLECSNIIKQKDFTLNQKVEQIQLQYAEIEELKHSNKLLNAQIDILVSDETDIDTNINETTLEEKIKYLNQFKIILICGKFGLITKLNSLGWENVVQHDSYEDYGTYDYACIQTKFCSHSHTARFRSHGETQREHTFYFNQTNATLLINSCYEYIYQSEHLDS